MNLIPSFFSLESQRKRLLNKAPEGALKQYLSVPIIDLDKPIIDSDILAVDFETTGLNAKHDAILSIGYVELANNHIHLGSCYHQIVAAHCALDEDNVTIHTITDQEKASGRPLASVVEDLLIALAGKTMLVHYAQIEKTFLEQACIKLYGMAPIFPIIDTLALAKKRHDRCNQVYLPSALHLTNLRQEYGLPHYPVHNALNDAIATAELFMAKIQYSEQRERTKLKSLVTSVFN
ncbi:DNA polymerase III subunit epsilon [Moritella sp. 24]|uniref:exonuclease domain-containing protein n=1 Tax=Moritella sp. 24 TaxID=2746230 RepID=UPI001BA5D4A9|nr:exonuclease domain-containing protein [Moritella sp. 24]QUM76386.1 DNA polymerase III subunit epsilon [Moritella sp. 24]